MSDGIVLYTEEGDPVRVCLMDDNDERLTCYKQLEQGMYAYRSPETSLTMILEKP